MSSKKVSAQRALATRRTKPTVVAALGWQAGGAEPTPVAAARNQQATMSPIRPWRGTPRPASWQPGTWGDPL